MNVTLPSFGGRRVFWGKFYPFLFVSVLRFFFICWESFNIFSQNFLQLFLVLAWGSLHSKFFFTSCPPSAGHHFGIFLSLFWQIVLDICQVFSHGILGRCCCSSEGHCTIFLIWRNISLILSNCSIFSHELCSLVLGITLIITNITKFFTSCPPLLGAILPFWGISWPILAYYIYFLKIAQYFLMIFYIDVLGVLLRVTALFFPYHDPTAKP